MRQIGRDSLHLTWQASTDAVSASWLTLDTSSGAVQPGTTPQTIQVIVSTTGLTAGNYTDTIHITSNGGTAQVSVTLTVPATQPGSPTPPHTPPRSPLIGSPNGFSVPGDPNCTYSSRVGWTCTATLNTSASTQSNLNWTASSTGVSGVTFSPPGGTLFPGKPVTVKISISNTTCPASANFTFNGPVNQVLMPWSCAAPTLSVSKSGFNVNTDCSFSNGWTCTESLSTASNTQGNLSWSASSSGINGISFSPASGILSPGQSAQVTISNIPCVSSGIFTFSGGAKPVSVSWGCGS